MIQQNLIKSLFSAFVIIFTLQSNTSQAVDLHMLQQLSKKAPSETMQFGRLVGNWAISDSGLDKEGNWISGPGADWNFYWILNGTAIQDDWISPPLDKTEPEKGRQFGTNIRIYNPKLKQWEMAWASNNGAKVDTFKAKAEGESVVMKGFYAGAETKITFFNISKNHFSWKMEQQDKDTKAWKEVYRIEGERK